MSLYPVVIVWEWPSGELGFTWTGRRPHEGESEGQFVDRQAMSALATEPKFQTATRRPNKLTSQVDPLRRSFRPTWARDVYFPLPGESVDDLAPEVQHHRFLRLVGGNVVVAPAPLRQEYMRLVRLERGRRLMATDHDRIRLEEIGTAQQRQALATYRQALRDLPATVQADLAALTTPEELEAYNLPWPVAPS